MYNECFARVPFETDEDSVISASCCILENTDGSGLSASGTLGTGED